MSVLRSIIVKKPFRINNLIIEKGDKVQIIEANGYYGLNIDKGINKSIDDIDAAWGGAIKDAQKYSLFAKLSKKELEIKTGEDVLKELEKRLKYLFGGKLTIDWRA